jgi:uracil-DNA glycosylase
MLQTWQEALGEEKQKPYFKEILAFLKSQTLLGKKIYPASENIFNALKLTPFDQIKVVILGQDPYHGPKQAHGLSFSVLPGVAAPPSLQNIFKEIHQDLGLPIPNHGHLEKWARQGVLLLNTSLSVEAGKPQSHAKIGWEQFTNKIIEKISQEKTGLVFLLWGTPAQKKAELIDKNKHYILKAAHPSPLSAHRGFFGCKHFSKTNEILKSLGKEPIDWAL